MSDEDPVFYVGLRASWIEVLKEKFAPSEWCPQELRDEIELGISRVRAYRILDSPDWKISQAREKQKQLDELEIEL